ncbi:hypothetical protein Rhopal_006906-T1 [Rhodotorula paludigena]|uniref:Major facilitator superfamily (MFS) profile domain-containing protein n=1 Tax=Rhodotorula paludigena TaxID=86838 RepID=A0AAV5GXS8_9BASI|nr:hypothetical protein Rhopal_006906-T1 [Rhodotorula paludigena]
MVGFAGGGAAVAGLPQTAFRHNIRAFVLTLFVGFGTFQYNLDTTIINGFQAMQGFLRVFGDPAPSGKYVIDKTFQQLITSLLQVGLILSSILIGPFSRYWGRRAGFFVASVIGVVALLIQEFVTTREPVYIGRLLLGMSNGAYVNLVVLWISETAPSHLRAPFVSSFQIFQGLGGIVGAVISKQFATRMDKLAYQAQLVVLFAVPLWFMIYAWFMPESPRWLATQDRLDDATRSLRRIRGPRYAEEHIQVEINAIKDAIAAEKAAQEGASVLDIFRGTDLRLILKVCGFAGALVSPFLARRFGRKHILIAGFAIITTCFLIIGAVNEKYPTNGTSGASQSAGAAMLAFVSIYEFAEIPSNRLRSLTMGFAMGVGFVAAWLTVFTTPRYLNELGVRVAWIWMPSAFLTLLFLIFFLPETQGRTLEEIDQLFALRVSAWKFKNYKLEGAPTISKGRDFDNRSDGEKEKAEESREEEARVAMV